MAGYRESRVAGPDAQDDDLDALLAEQMAYYDARAPEYDKHFLSTVGEDELQAALDAFGPAGDLLELACGTGEWTARLLRYASTVTAVDASAEMLSLAAARVAHDDRVRFVQADLFGWRPERRYDVVFFGFWLSHVPLERFESFWALVADCLEPGCGRFFFVDDAHRTPDELVEGEESSTVQRRLDDGSLHRAVKVPHRPAELARRIERLGWQATVTQTSGPFFWGSGRRGRPAAQPSSFSSSS